MCVLSAMLHSDTACVKAFDSLTEDDFENPFSRALFLLAQTLFHRGVKPTYAEILKEGTKFGWLESMEDIDKLSRVADHYIDDENIGYWAGKVKQASKGRAMEKLLRRYSYELTQDKTDIPELIQRASNDFFNLAMDIEEENFMTGQQLGEHGQELIDARAERYRQAMEDAKHPGEMPLEGVPTGLPTLDKLTLGYKPGDLIMLAAQTGHGKTAFALNTANAVCVEGQKPLLYINTEMSKDQIVTRWGSILSGQLVQQLRNGSLTNAQLEETKEAYKKLIDSNFITFNMPSPTASKVDIITRKAIMQYQIEMTIIDYVGRMQKIQKGLEEWQVLEQIMKTNKELAQNKGIAVMVLAQLNDNDSVQGAKRMRNECDMVLKLLPVNDAEGKKDFRKDIEKRLKKKFEPDFNYVLYVDKARDFETGVYIPLVFDGTRQQIREAKEIGAYTPEPPRERLGPRKKSKDKVPTGWEEIAIEIDPESRE